MVVPFRDTVYILIKPSARAEADSKGGGMEIPPVTFYVITAAILLGTGLVAVVVSRLETIVMLGGGCATKTSAVPPTLCRPPSFSSIGPSVGVE